jgi:GntR family transcriptional repressor for pyruvate dehydrogenase complex
MINNDNEVRVRFNSVRLPKAAQVLATQIKQEIISGKYPEGAMLPPEQEMALQLNVSRPTVRESLRLLESEGLISIRPGPRGGPRVERPDTPTVTRALTTLFQYEKVSLADLLEARRAIEPACAHVAASRATAEDIAALRRSVHQMRARLNEDSLFWDENANFHLAVVTAARNIVLNTLMIALRELIYQFTEKLVIPAEERSNTLADHTAIMEAIAAHDPDAAAETARAHLVHYEQRLRENFPDLAAVRLNSVSSAPAMSG